MTSSVKVMSLKCTTCGADLQITPDMERFACGYCGSAQIVQRQGGTVSLKPVIEAITKVQVGTDKAAAELAITRLEKQLQDAIERYDKQSYIVDNPDIPRPYTYLWGVLLICLGIVCLNIPGGILAGLFWFGVAGLVGLYIVYRLTATKSLREEQQKELNTIASELDSIRNKLAANHKIVNS